MKNYRPGQAVCPTDCIYNGAIQNDMPCCNYLLAEGHSRGCPPGKDCIRYKTGKKKSKWAEG